MMTKRSVVALFPGQGAYYAGALRESLEDYPEIRSTFAAIDTVAAEMLGRAVSDRIFSGAPPSIADLLADDPDVLQLAIFGLSVATYQILEGHGLRPAALLGHSFGEIAALVCAGAFSVRDGAAIVCHRIAALQTCEAHAGGAGYMAALGMDAFRAQKVVDLVGDQDTVVAVENHPGQTVVSGPPRVMAAVEQLAGVLRLPFVRLNAPYPFHSPLLAPAVAAFAARLRPIRQRPLRVPVYSPIMERYYDPEDDLTDCLAQHLVRRVRFAAAVEQVYGEGTAGFVECGALDALGKIVRRVLPDAEPITIACLDPSRGDRRSLDEAITTLRHHELIDGVRRDDLGAALLPGIDRVAFAAFWAARGAQVLAHVQQAFDAYCTVTPVAAAVTAAVAAPAAAPEPVPAPPPEPAMAPGTAAAPPATLATPATPVTREALFQELAAMYAAALEYPVEVFTEDVELEAELGVDSVKQTELMARVAEHYHLPPRPADLRLSEYSTMGKVADFVYALLQPAGAGASTNLDAYPATGPAAVTLLPAAA